MFDTVSRCQICKRSWIADRAKGSLAQWRTEMHRKNSDLTLEEGVSESSFQERVTRQRFRQRSGDHWLTVIAAIKRARRTNIFSASRSSRLRENY